MNTMELKAEIVRKGYSVPVLAKEIGISKKALYCKMTGKSNFKLNEMRKIINILNLTNEKILYIFFERSAS